MLRSIIASVTLASAVLAVAAGCRAAPGSRCSRSWSVTPSRMSAKNGLRMSGSITPMVYV